MSPVPLLSPLTISLSLSPLIARAVLSSATLPVDVSAAARWLPVGFEQTAHLFIFGRNYLLCSATATTTHEQT